MRNERCSENVVVDKIRNAGMKAKIRDEMEPTKGPVEVLVSWSEKILKDFRSRNVEIRPATDLASLIRATNTQSTLLKGICQRQSNVKTKLDALLQQSVKQESKQEEFLNMLRQVLGAAGETVIIALQCCLPPMHSSSSKQIYKVLQRNRLTF
jgi:hypothetical protein